MTDDFDDLADLIGDEAPHIAPDPEPQPETDVKSRRPFQNWTDGDIEGMPELAFLVGDDEHPILLEGALWQTIGLLKSGKTFYCLELAFCVAFGLPFHGHAVKDDAGPVVYILAEGGIKRNYRRIRALFIKYKSQMAELGFDTLAQARASGRLLLIDQTIALADIDTASPIGPNAFVEEIERELGERKPSVIFLDTWARSLWASGGHDSDQTTVGPSIAACDAIRKALGGCSLVMVAHIGAAKDAQGRAKGLTDPAGAIDGGTLCKKIGTGPLAIFAFKAIYQRHAAEDYTVHSNLKVLSGAPSAVLVPAAGAAVKLSKRQRELLDVLRALPPGSGITEWIAAVMVAGTIMDESGQPANRSTVRKAVGRVRDELVKLDVIEEIAGMITIRDAADDDGGDDCGDDGGAD